MVENTLWPTKTIKMAKKSDFKAGRGRSKSLVTATYGAPSNRLKYKCLVPSCNLESRADYLKGHYKNTVKETDEEFFNLTQAEKQHTLFFEREGLYVCRCLYVVCL